MPKLRKSQIENLPFLEKIKAVKEIWNYSLSEYKNNNELTEYIIFEEMQVFNFNIFMKDIFDEKISIRGNQAEYLLNNIYLNLDCAVDLLIKNNFKSIFLERFLKIKEELQNKTKEEIFDKGLGKFHSIKLLLLVEGITEEKLLPVFAKKAGFDFNQNGIKLKAIGGKNPILRFYTENRKLFNIPVFILLDADGVDIEQNLISILNSKDKLYLIKSGEIEDTIPKELIIKSLNNYYNNYGLVEEKDLVVPLKMTKVLNDLYKQKGFGEFQKAEFAQILANNITSKSDIPQEINQVFSELSLLIKNFKITR